MSKFNGLLNLTKDDECIYSDYSIKGIKNTDKIIYKENDISVTIFIHDNTIEMKRIATDYNIDMVFMNKNNTTGIYYLKDIKGNIELSIKNNIVIYNQNGIYIDYNLFMANLYIGHFIFSLKFEVEEL